MSTTYSQARSLLKSVADELAAACSESRSEEIPLADAVGRITAEQYVSPLTTPTFDSSAMDGYAVAAAATRHASLQAPVALLVADCVVAGDALVTTTSCSSQNGINPCIEIMTGARMPSVPCGEEEFDAVIRLEDTTVVDVVTPVGSLRCIQVTKPVARHSHVRLAGSDFCEGDLVLPPRVTVRPHHIMALASLGIGTVAVLRKLKAGVWSTGHELLADKHEPSKSSKIMDANGPFLQASLREWGMHVDFLGIIDDCDASFRKSLVDVLVTRQYDVLISTGAVSRGKFDFVPSALKAMNASVWFHGVSMRPGHPVLFATLPSVPQTLHRSPAPTYPTTTTLHACRGSTAFFGLPGNPIAAAACSRFLVQPYLRCLQGMLEETPRKARIELQKSPEVSDRTKPFQHLDRFQHGYLSEDESGGWIVQPSVEQSPAKMKPFSIANCWCHRPSGGSNSVDDRTVDCFPL